MLHSTTAVAGLPPETVADYKDAARRHMSAACALLEAPSRHAVNPDDHANVAAYLAGYAIECALKAHLIERAQARAITPGSPTDLNGALRVLAAAGPPTSAYIDDVRKPGGRHNLNFLRAATGLDARMGVARRQDWSICEFWDVAWRYRDLWAGKPQEARSLVRAAFALYHWITKQTAIAP
jgi:hypothetical protein